MRSGFYNSEIVGWDASTGLPQFDRAENAEFMAKYLSSFFKSGVFPEPSDSFQVLESTPAAQSVTVRPGLAWINGYFAWEDMSRVLTVQAAESLDRIDRVVLRLNLALRKIDLFIIKGTAATEPIAPPLIRPTSGQAGDIYDLGIANIFVTKNTSVINQHKITDTRLDNNVCGIVSGTVSQVDTTSIYTQFQDALNRFLGDVNAAISGTLYGQLMAQITSETINTTLAAANWQGTEVPFTYALSVAGVTTTSNQDITYSPTANKAQIEACQNANIVQGIQANNVINLRAFGEKPTIDIPITIVKRGVK